MPSLLRENARFIILAAALLLAVGIHACATRYQAIFDSAYSRTIVVDHWTGSTTVRH